MRGFVIDNRFNYRRDGLPISAETSIPLDNKSRVEVLKGTSGMLAGIGSPGGMVNLVVKRPTDAPIREGFIGWRQNGSVLASTDLSDRFGEQREFGLRLNAAYEHIDPQTYVAEGSRYLLALAGDWRLNADTVLEAEIENSRRSQPSVPGFSVLGSVVPRARQPAHQPEQPAVVAAGGVRGHHRLAALAPAAGRAMALGGAGGHAAAEDRRQHRLPLRLQRRERLRPLLQRRHLRPVRLSQRERAPPQRRGRRGAERHAAHRQRCATR